MDNYYNSRCVNYVCCVLFPCSLRLLRKLSFLRALGWMETPLNALADCDGHLEKFCIDLLHSPNTKQRSNNNLSLYVQMNACMHGVALYCWRRLNDNVTNQLATAIASEMPQMRLYDSKFYNLNSG